jgi:hypothetical protein
VTLAAVALAAATSVAGEAPAATSAAAAAAVAAAEAKIPNGERCDHRRHFPESGSTCEGIHSEKIIGRKSKFLFTAQLLRNLDLADIFSDSRSGTIAHKNKKRITAVTQYDFFMCWVLQVFPNKNPQLTF